ncbi:unnamed protein product, partial [Closterium sp. NIES-54]
VRASRNASLTPLFPSLLSPPATAPAGEEEGSGGGYGETHNAFCKFMFTPLLFHYSLFHGPSAHKYSKQQSVIQQLQARSGRLMVICSEGDADLMCPNGAAKIIEVPHVEDCLQPIINIIPLQLLAYHLTVIRGLNVDQPRNLAKSVTVE